MKISATIITRDEEKALPLCLENIRDFVDEIVVVDSGSTDKTMTIARAKADLVVEHAFENFSKQKNHAASLATHAWILNIDADELLSDELKNWLTIFRRQSQSRYQAYCFPRKTYGQDGEMLFNIVSYPGFHYRLYHRDFCRWRNPVHETLEVDGRRKFCAAHLLHYPNYDRVPQKVELYNSLKRQPDPEKRRYTAGQTIGNFWFHFRALFFDLGFLWKGWTYWKHGAHILIHLAGLRLKQRES